MPVYHSTGRIFFFWSRLWGMVSGKWHSVSSLDCRIFISLFGWPEENNTAVIYAAVMTCQWRQGNQSFLVTSLRKWCWLAYGQILDWTELIPDKIGASEERKLQELIIPNQFQNVGHFFFECFHADTFLSVLFATLTFELSLPHHLAMSADT